MPCIIKNPTDTSPGIITFTHNEALRGLPRNSAKVRDFLIESHNTGKWKFGVHIQGDCSYLDSWPLEPWQSFVMWPDRSASFLKNLPEEKFCPFTCVNFMPAYLAESKETTRCWDICVISRASSIKRLENTLLLLRSVLDTRPETKIVMIVPDPRHLSLGEKAYKKQGIDEGYFKSPKKIFSAKELKQISFISSSQDSFGNFPLAGELVAEVLGKSKFLFLNSYLEGVPRVIAEALMLRTPCIVSDHLRSGLNGWLDENNSIRIPDDPTRGAYQVVEGLRQYEDFFINQEKVCEAFLETKNIQEFKNYLSELIRLDGSEVEGLWFLEDLHLRLACHGQKQDFQLFHNEKLFFTWIDQVLKLENSQVDEDFLFESLNVRDRPSFYFQTKELFFHLPRSVIKRLRALVGRILAMR